VHLPSAGPFVLVADVLWFKFVGHDWGLFLLALKPTREDKAYFLDPVLLPGGESYENWSRALRSVPEDLQQGVKALVTDGFRCAPRLAQEHGWIHQRCHFHLIAYLQVRRGRRNTIVPGRPIREKIYQTVLALLAAREPLTVRRSVARLKRLASHPDCPRSMQMTVSETIRNLDAFRAYCLHPRLHLPTTTGTAEAMGKLIRKRVETVRTQAALQLWATAIVRSKSPLTCNGKNVQQN